MVEEKGINHSLAVKSKVLEKRGKELAAEFESSPRDGKENKLGSGGEEGVIGIIIVLAPYGN